QGQGGGQLGEGVLEADQRAQPRDRRVHGDQLLPGGEQPHLGRIQVGLAEQRHSTGGGDHRGGVVQGVTVPLQQAEHDGGVQLGGELGGERDRRPVGRLGQLVAALADDRQVVPGGDQLGGDDQVRAGRRPGGRYDAVEVAAWPADVRGQL